LLYQTPQGGGSAPPPPGQPHFHSLIQQQFSPLASQTFVPSQVWASSLQNGWPQTPPGQLLSSAQPSQVQLPQAGGAPGHSESEPHPSHHSSARASWGKAKSSAPRKAAVVKRMIFLPIIVIVTGPPT
jgi:hypothetical protein